MAPVATTTAATIPDGQYKVVSIALDLTGKKLIDEICQVGAYYHPQKTFSQYVMPHRDISRSSIRTHGVRIVTNFNKYRVLKEANSMRTMRTKSEYSTLCEFLEWLKEAKGDSDGILLAFHDNNKEILTPFLLEALNRYKIGDDFFKMVAGFVNIANFVSEKNDLKEHGATLRSLCKHLLTNEELKSKDKNNKPLLLQSAKDRAEFSYKVLQKIMKSEDEVDCSSLVPYCATREVEMSHLEKLQVASAKISSLRPIFVERMRKGIKERTRAVALRKYLIEGVVDYEMLKCAFEKVEGSKDAIVEIVSKTSAAKKETDMDELVEMIISHFKKDKNAEAKEIGQGEPAVAVVNGTGTSASSSETDEEEFEEAHEDGIEK